MSYNLSHSSCMDTQHQEVNQTLLWGSTCCQAHWLIAKTPFSSQRDIVTMEEHRGCLKKEHTCKQGSRYNMYWHYCRFVFNFLPNYLISTETPIPTVVTKVWKIGSYNDLESSSKVLCMRKDVFVFVRQDVSDRDILLMLEGLVSTV